MSDKDTECCLCYESYGNQPNGTWLCMDGIKNSFFDIQCNHWFCVKCIYKMKKQPTPWLCPLCRLDWTEFIESHYDSDESHYDD